jgi:hypothetical protein
MKFIDACFTDNIGKPINGHFIQTGYEVNIISGNEEKIEDSKVLV